MPIVISGLAAAGAVNPLPAIRNAVTLDRVSHVKLAVGPWYALFAPLYDVWDAFSLFTALQHFAVVALVAAAVIIGDAVWPLAAEPSTGAESSRSPRRR